MTRITSNWRSKEPALTFFQCFAISVTSALEQCNDESSRKWFVERVKEVAKKLEDDLATISGDEIRGRSK